MDGLFVYGRDKSAARAYFAPRQQGRCAICGKKSSRLLLDHEHSEEGLCRGLLCHSCNVALGWLEDSTESLRAAIVYLERHEAKNTAYRETADWLERKVTKTQRPFNPVLTSEQKEARDIEIAEAVRAGHTNREIAARLAISPNVVSRVAARVTT